MMWNCGSYNDNKSYTLFVLISKTNQVSLTSPSLHRIKHPFVLLLSIVQYRYQHFIANQQAPSRGLHGSRVVYAIEKFPRPAHNAKLSLECKQNIKKISRKSESSINKHKHSFCGKKAGSMNPKSMIFSSLLLHPPPNISTTTTTGIGQPAKKSSD